MPKMVKSETEITKLGQPEMMQKASEAENIENLTKGMDTADLNTMTKMFTANT